MKFAIVLTVLFLFCATQAQKYEYYVEYRCMIKEKLKDLIDYLEAEVQPPLLRTRNGMRTNIFYTNEVINETYAKGRFRQEQIEKMFQEKRSRELHEAADKFKVDTFKCDQKTRDVMIKVAKYRENVEHCAKNTESRYKHLETLHEYIDQIEYARRVIDEQLSKAKKCFEDDILMTSIEAATCLTEAKNDAEKAKQNAPTRNTFLNSFMKYRKIYNELEMCDSMETFTDIYEKANLVKAEVNLCIFDLLVENMKEIRSIDNSTHAQSGLIA